MVKNWDIYSRQGIDFASAVTSWGFGAAKIGTKFGFSVARSVAATTVGITSTVVDHAIFGGSAVTRPILDDVVSSVISFAEKVTLAPIFLSEYVTATSLIAAHGSVNILSVIFPGSSDASFSLASFITLVKREWSESASGGSVPEYGITNVARAIIAWVALQGVTQERQEKIWLQHLKEIHVNDISDGARKTLPRRNSRVRVTSDVIFPGNRAQIIAADIGEAPTRAQSWKFTNSSSIAPFTSVRPRAASVITDPPRLSNSELKTTLRRLSKIVLAGYGGASLLFFGVSPTSTYRGSRPSSSAAEMALEEAQLASAIDASEAEASGEFPAQDAQAEPGNSGDYSWWDILLGRHDQEIFERAAGLGVPSQKAKEELKAKINATAAIGSEHMMPRFWVLTDHGRCQVVLVLRGTMSLNEIAADLTCEPEYFEPVTTAVSEQDLPGQYDFPTMHSSSSSTTSPQYHVHGGMLRMAHAMGNVGKPVHLAVQGALHNNPEYELVICGHSLGAGVAAILGMMWADLKTCLTVRSSGLPRGRRVFVYCFAPPALTDAALSKLADRLIVSFVYSHDVVSRLSLGSVRDLKNAALWLCEAEENKQGGEGWTAVTTRAKRWKAGVGSSEDPHWFIAVRKTLEANMQMSNMFPPGRVLWAMRDSDLHPPHRSYSTGPSSTGPDKLRLFEVLDNEKVFSQIVFARDMLTSHMPHQYDRVLHDLL